jgi:hypothetical protein
MPYSEIMLSAAKPVTALILFGAAILCFGQRPVRSLSFSSEDERVTDFVQLPGSALLILLKDKEAFPDGMPSDLRCEDHEQSGDKPRPELLCRRLPLSQHPGEDYLVIGVGDLRGAHIVPFWLIHQDERGASLLFKSSSDQIEIMRNRFNGYAEVRATWIQRAGATIVTDSFRFDGKKYVRYRGQTQHQ